MSTIQSSAASPSNVQTTGSAATQQFGQEFNNFIKLLTAQVQNQDPLSPMDSTQFVDQLATFSSLEQQVQTNSNLSGITSLIADLHTMFASEWLGQTVTVSSSWVPYDGTGIQFLTDAPASADGATLTIRNSEGDLVWSEELDLDDDVHSWNGQTNTGDAAAANEVFEFNIDFYQGDDYVGLTAPKVITTITEVGSENGMLRFATSSHLSADLNSVSKYSKPE